MKPITVPLENIKNHPVFKKPEIREKFITNEFLLDDPKALILPEMIPYLLELHPIQVIPGKNDSYYCVGGLRSLSIVRHLLLPSEKVEVLCLEKMRDDVVLNRCLVDILVATSCFTVSSKESVYKTLLFFRENIRDELLVTEHRPSRIAKMLQVHVETVRLWSKKPPKIPLITK